MNLLLTSLINHHFYFFNQVFYTQLPGCLGSEKSRAVSHTEYMYKNGSLEVIYIVI